MKPVSAITQERLATSKGLLAALDFVPTHRTMVAAHITNSLASDSVLLLKRAEI